MELQEDKVPILDMEKLKVLSPLGRGAKGVVFLVRNEASESDDNGDHQLLALKAISRTSIAKKAKNKESDGDEYRRIWLEQEVLRRCEHPLLPKLRGVLSTESIVGYAIDYCPGRDLNYLRKKQTEKMFSDDLIRFYAAELILALEYLHGLGIVYRDLKPENVMIQENGHLMLVDFDLSAKLSPKPPSNPSIITPPSPKPATNSNSKPNPSSKKKKKKKRLFSSFYTCFLPPISSNDSVHPAESVNSANSVKSAESDSVNSVSRSNSFVGTEEYVAPEMIKGNGHDYSVDWWCLGVVLHEFLYGTTPFRGINRKETFYRILSMTPELVGEPTPLRDLIRRLLEKDAKQRITAPEIKGHDFFKGVDWEKVVEISRPPFIPPPGRLDDEGRDVIGQQQIDMEDFVKGVFKVDGDVIGDVREKERDQNFVVF